MTKIRPKVSGFTLIRNGCEFDYPFRESIQSILPIVDELVINVGEGTDRTETEIQKLSEKEPKIRIIHSRWPLDDPEKRKSGMILAEQTNLALKACQHDWCVYLQADEVLHEKDHFLLSEQFRRFADIPEVEGLLFQYRHFYGSYDVIQDSRSAYRREVRAIKKSAHPQSVGDAQSFRKEDGSKLAVIESSARIFHYGWVRTPEKMKSKTHFMDQLYHGENQSEDPHSGEAYRYKRFWGLKPYQESHPQFMSKRIETKGWHWDLKMSEFAWEWKDLKKIASDFIERWTGHRLFEYRSFQLLPHPKTSDLPIHSPVASVIVSTYNNPKPLEMILNALNAQSYPYFEVFVCDDGSGTPTRELMNQFIQNQSQYRIHHLWQEDQGFRKCRILNQALKKAQGEIVIFLDGDCVPHDDFVKDHVDFCEEGVYLAGRRVELGEKLSNSLSPKDVDRGFFFRPNLKLFWDCLRGQSQFFHRSLRVTAPWLRKWLKLNRIDDMKGCNYSVSREALIRINGFDEDYEGYGREDTDVELRLQNLGLKLKSAKGIALQYHIWHPRREFTPKNDMRLETLKKSNRYWCQRGLDSSARPMA